MITWQNATEGSTEIETGDYVTINGVDYPVKTKLSSTTPLSAENLNTNQASLKDFIQENNGNYILADSEKLDITAVANLQDILNNFNLSVFEAPTNVTTTAGSILTNTLQVARNTDGSLAKIYGTVSVTGITTSGSTPVTVSFKTSLRPASSFSILNCALYRIINNSGQQSLGMISLTIGTDGTATLQTVNWFSDTSQMAFFLVPCLYWIKDFGDQPEE